MEELNIIGEQPNDAEVHAVATGVEEGTDTQSGSPLGKFKDATKLLDAYNELQSEFTRKCQKLSDAEKKLQQYSDDQTDKSDSNQNQAGASEEFAWTKNIGEFLQSHTRASDYIEDITNEILGSEDLVGREDALDKAYSRVMEKKFVSHDELAHNQEFLDKYIYSNDEIKNKIIKEYVTTLQKSQNPIAVANEGFSRSVAAGESFRSLEDARSYVENMFKF